MVYMSDSARAAKIARSLDLPVGLHLNITQSFEDPAVPTAVRERHTQLLRHFAGGRRSRFTFNPLLIRSVERCIADQLECFRELFGHDPTHIDGHNHAHLSPTVLFALPKGMRTRTAESYPRANRRPASVIRRARHKLIARRHITTDRFFAVDRLGPHPTESDIDKLLSATNGSSTEIMVHPDRDSDHRLLMSEAWSRTLQQRPLGSFLEL
jgi:predicted glycoside hydrolase/deacetylase ChbG (UPF0249 family)